MIYKQVFIKSKDDLPKGELGTKNWGHTRSGRMIETDIAWTWRVNDVDWYLLPCEIEMPSDEEIENIFPMKDENKALTMDCIRINNAKRDGAKWLKSEIIKRNK